MNLYCINHNYRYEAEKLLRLFFPLIKFNEKTEFEDTKEDYLLTEILLNGGNRLLYARLSLGGITEFRERITDAEADIDEERELLLLAYEMLCKMTCFTPKWGILTGVRPSKLLLGRLISHGAEDAARWFRDSFKVSEEKTELALSVAERELEIVKKAGENTFSLYISIPFCPTRCSYCSFVSHSVNTKKARELIPQYVEKLCEEIRITGEIAREQGLRLTAVYWGGGTPTTLECEDLDRVLTEIENNFDLSTCIEYTVEAGRPDTITEDKLLTLKKHGVGRISINPQSFNDSVLKAIGRCHSVGLTEERYLLARRVGFDSINMDLIAGLPTDTLDSFKNSIDRAVELSADNITVHTLALKTSSSLVTENEQGSVSGRDIEEMLGYAQKTLTEKGYKPYYMYRQSKSLGNLENVGWCKEGKECIYNVLMMEEYQSIFSVGASAVTKLRSKDGSVIERIFNFKYPFEYISRFSLLIEKKVRMRTFFEEYNS